MYTYTRSSIKQAILPHIIPFRGFLCVRRSGYSGNPYVIYREIVAKNSVSCSLGPLFVYFVFICAQYTICANDGLGVPKGKLDLKTRPENGAPYSFYFT